MGLLAPLFLTGLLAIAIPVWVHLVHRERKDPLAFPSLMFLRRIPFRSERRQRIRFWLLFLMRAAALALIALAFARPWLPQRAAAVAGSGGRDIVILIDRSYSMTAGDTWREARAAALATVRDAAPGDRIAVVAFGTRAELLARFEDDRDRAIAGLQQLDPGFEATSYAPALRLAGSLLTHARAGSEIVWITDRQAGGWRNIEPVAAPAGTTVRVVDVANEDTRNTTIGGARLIASTFAGQRRLTPVATVINRGAATADVALELRIGDRPQQTMSVRVPARDSARVSFTPVQASAPAGELRIMNSDAIAADNVAHFTTAGSEAPVVRVVGSGEAAFYFENALLAGDSTAFRLTRSNAAFSDLADVDVVVLLEAAAPRGAAAERLSEFVRGGGGLIAFAPAGDADILPVRNVAPADRRARPASFTSVDRTHPAFSAFRTDGADPFAGARVTRYVRAQPADGAAVLVSLDDGAPALVEQAVGRGTSMFWAGGLSRRAGDFVLQPAFVPFVQQLVRHAAARTTAATTQTVGDVVAVDNYVARDRDAVVITPARERIQLAGGERARSLRVEQPGIYQVRAQAADARTTAIAVNVDPAESGAGRVPAAQFAQAVNSDGGAANVSAAGFAPANERERQLFWWYLLLAAFVLLAAETIMSNRLSGARLRRRE